MPSPTRIRSRSIAPFRTGSRGFLPRWLSEQSRVAAPEPAQGGDYVGAQLSARAGFDLGEGRHQRQRGAVGTVAREGVEGVGDEDDTSRQRNLVTTKAVWISVAVDALVARARALADDRVQLELGKNVVGDERVRAHDRPLRLVERPRLAQD